MLTRVDLPSPLLSALSTMAPDISAPLYSAAGPSFHQSKGTVTGSASSDRILIIGSMAAAQTGQYQEAVQQAGQGGSRQVEMHMADRLTDGGEQQIRVGVASVVA